MRVGTAVGATMGCALALACGLTSVGSLEPADSGADPTVLDAGLHDASDRRDATTDAGEDAAEGGLVDATTDADASADAGAGLAHLFDGTNDFVRITRQVQDDFTLEAWINTTTSRNGSNFYDGLGLLYADVSGAANDFGTSILNGKFAFGGVSTTVQSTTTVTSGTWVHVAAVRVKATGKMSVLVNGAAEANVTGSTASLNAPPSIDFGGNTIDNRYFKGMIDEVRIWNVARTAADIQATMRVRLVGNEPGLVGYYRFDEGSGVTAVDSSPSGNAGSLGNGDATARPTWVPSTAF
jgi:Concanavalin A-like lectin/glucanases superfamily